MTARMKTVTLPGDTAPKPRSGHATVLAPDQAVLDRVAALRDRLIAYRKDQDISHPELAKRMRLHLSRAINAEECAPDQLRVTTLLRYAEALGVDLLLDFTPKA